MSSRNASYTVKCPDARPALASAGIASLALKGAALAPYYGNDPGARPMFDVDLVVDTGSFNEAGTLSIVLAAVRARQ